MRQAYCELHVYNLVYWKKAVLLWLKPLVRFFTLNGLSFPESVTS